MTQTAELQRINDKYGGLHYSRMYIDDTGIGRGVSDRMEELMLSVNPVAFGESAEDKSRYTNKKMELFWAFKTWLARGGKILYSDAWNELLEMKYKITSDKLLQMEPKEDLKKRLGKSPDFADAGALTFATSSNDVIAVYSDDIRG